MMSTMKLSLLIAAVLAVTTCGQSIDGDADPNLFGNKVNTAIEQVSKAAPNFFGQIPEIVAAFLYSQREDFLDVKEDLLKRFSSISGDVDTILKMGLKTAIDLVDGLNEILLLTHLADKGFAYKMTSEDELTLDSFLKSITTGQVSIIEWNLIAIEFPPKNPSTKTQSQFSIIEIAPTITKELVRTFFRAILKDSQDEITKQKVIGVLKTNTAEVDKLIKEWYNMVLSLPHFSQSNAEYKQLSTELATKGLAFNLTKDKFQEGIANFNPLFKNGFTENVEYFVKVWNELQAKHRGNDSNSSAATNVLGSLCAFTIFAVINVRFI